MYAIRTKRWPVFASILAIGVTAGAVPACADGGLYKQTNLVSDIPGLAAATDPDLVNPWGISFSPTGPFWISDNGPGLTTLYNGAGTKQGLIVAIPAPAGSPAGSTSPPTGQVFNGGSAFVVTDGVKSAPARFLFATEDGTISGWNPGVNLTQAVLAVDNSGASAVYKGLAIASTPSGPRLFAANFRSGAIDVFDGSFQPVASITDPSAPAGYAPFNVQAIGSRIVVTFAKQDAAKHDDEAGPGNGLIDIMDPSTLAIWRFATGRGAGGRLRQLNSPWGVALAPATFGRFRGALLVGNFGDGRISAFDPVRGHFLGQLEDRDDHPLSIDGLWGLSFGNGGSAGSADVLYFTAGLDGEQHGLFGTVAAMPEHRHHR